MRRILLLLTILIAGCAAPKKKVELCWGVVGGGESFRVCGEPRQVVEFREAMRRSATESYQSKDLLDPFLVY